LKKLQVEIIILGELNLNKGTACIERTEKTELQSQTTIPGNNQVIFSLFVEKTNMTDLAS